MTDEQYLQIAKDYAKEQEVNDLDLIRKYKVMLSGFIKAGK